MSSEWISKERELFWEENFGNWLMLRSRKESLSTYRFMTTQGRKLWFSFSRIWEISLGSLQICFTQLLGKLRSWNKAVDELLTTCHQLGCTMSLMTKILYSHLDVSQNCEAVSDEHGEGFAKTFQRKEIWYQGQLNASILAGYYWYGTQHVHK